MPPQNRRGPRTARLAGRQGIALTPLLGNADPRRGRCPPAPGREALSVCCQEKFLCIAEAGGTATNKRAQTYAAIVAALSTALADYDGMNLSPFSFSPVTPLFECP